MAVSTKFLLFVCCAALGVVLSSASTVPTTASSDTTNDETTTAAATEADTTTAAATEADTTTTAAETTTAPQPPFLCYECNSGSRQEDHWHNPNCNESGYINENWYPVAQEDFCNGYCFSKVGLYPAGVVFQGCAPDLTSDPVELGCRKDGNDYVCYCAGDKCQKDQDMSYWAQYYYTLYNTTFPTINWTNPTMN